MLLILKNSFIFDSLNLITGNDSIYKRNIHYLNL